MKIIDTFFTILICLMILASALFIGSPIRYNIESLTIFILILSIINIFFYNILFKKKIMKNKIDLLILLILTFSFIPLVFKTYVSLSSTVNGIFKHLTVLGMYIMCSNISNSNKIVKKWLVWSVIISAILCAFIGFDSFTFKGFNLFLTKLNCVKTINIENTMCGNFGYTNTFALTLSVASVLLIGEYLRIKNKLIKNLLLPINLFLFSMLLLAEANIILFIYICMVFFYLIRNKENVYELTIFISISLFTGLLHSMLFDKLCDELQYLETYILTLFISIFSYVFALLFYELIPVIKKIKLKYIVIFVIILFAILLIAFLIGIKLSAPLEIFENGANNNDIKYKIKNVESNKEYKFEFDIECQNKYGYYEIVIIEENKFFDTVKEHSLKFNNINSTKTLNFITDSATIEISMIFKSKALNGQDGLKINQLLINNKEYPLAYKYLPAQKINNLIGGVYQTKSIWERTSHYTDGVKIAKENIFTGIGESGWKYKKDEVESFEQSAVEVHSYIISLLINYGIFPVIIYLILLFLILKKFFYSIKDKVNLEIYLVILCITVHSFIDFNLSFFYLELIYFLLFVLVGDIENDKIYTKLKYMLNLLISLIIIIVFAIVVYFNILTCIYQYDNYKFESIEKYHSSILKYSKILPYNLKVQEELALIDYTKILNLLKSEQYYYTEYYCERLSKNNISNYEKEEIYNIMKNIKISISILKLEERNSAILKIANNFKEKNDYFYANKFYNLLIEEYENNKYGKIFNSAEENRITRKTFEDTRKLIEKNYEIAKQELIKEE